MLSLQVFETVEMLNCVGISNSHPPVVSRRAALTLGAMGALGGSALMNLKVINELSHALFSMASARAAVRNMPRHSACLNGLDEFQVTVIPLDRTPFVHLF